MSITEKLFETVNDEQGLVAGMVSLPFVETTNCITFRHRFLSPSVQGRMKRELLHVIEESPLKFHVSFSNCKMVV